MLGTSSFGLAGLYYHEAVEFFRLALGGSAPISTADKYCESKWVENARNDPALVCYLSSHTDRFCQPNERRHLAYVVERYLLDQERFGRQLAISLAGVRSRANNSQNGEIQATLNAAYKTEAQRLKDNGMEKAMKVRARKDEDLTVLLRALATRGLVEVQDFGRSPPDFILKAFLDLGQINKTCEIPAP